MQKQTLKNSNNKLAKNDAPKRTCIRLVVACLSLLSITYANLSRQVFNQAMSNMIKLSKTDLNLPNLMLADGQRADNSTDRLLSIVEQQLTLTFQSLTFLHHHHHPFFQLSNFNTQNSFGY